MPPPLINTITIHNHKHLDCQNIQKSALASCSSAPASLAGLQVAALSSEFPPRPTVTSSSPPVAMAPGSHRAGKKVSHQPITARAQPVRGDPILQQHAPNEPGPPSRSSERGFVHARVRLIPRRSPHQHLKPQCLMLPILCLSIRFVILLLVLSAALNDEACCAEYTES